MCEGEEEHELTPRESASWAPGVSLADAIEPAPAER